jgi:hypothetical protein
MVPRLAWMALDGDKDDRLRSGHDVPERKGRVSILAMQPLIEDEDRPESPP